MNKNFLPIAVIFSLFFMIAFVTNFTGPMGIIVKDQFETSNFLSQLGVFANFIAYACMGIPAGLLLKRKGYKFTSLAAVIVGFVGVGLQLCSGYAESFGLYLVGAFVAGFSMCMLNIVVNPLLNTLGGGGNRGNQLVQFGNSCNSIGGTLAPILLGYIIGSQTDGNTVDDAAPAMLIAMGIFAVAFLVILLTKIPEPHLENKISVENRVKMRSPLSFRHFIFGVIAIFIYVGVEVGIPNFANLHMSNDSDVGASIAGTMVGFYWLMMMFGRLIGGAIGSKVSSRQMLTVSSIVGMLLMAGIVILPETVEINFADDFFIAQLAGKAVPYCMLLMLLSGLCTSVMWGAIFNLATENLGDATPAASGIFMTMVCGGGIIPLLQGLVADHLSYALCYIVPLAGFAYILWFALSGSRSGR